MARIWVWKGCRPTGDGEPGNQITILAVERLKEVGIPSEVVVTRGNPGFLIPYFARKWSSELIFVRAHVRKDFEHWMVGSVAGAIVTSAPCTVQIVPRGALEEVGHDVHANSHSVGHCHFQTNP